MLAVVFVLVAAATTLAQSPTVALLTTGNTATLLHPDAASNIAASLTSAGVHVTNVSLADLPTLAASMLVLNASSLHPNLTTSTALVGFARRGGNITFVGGPLYTASPTFVPAKTSTVVNPMTNATAFQFDTAEVLRLPGGKRLPLGGAMSGVSALAWFSPLQTRQTIAAVALDAYNRSVGNAVTTSEHLLGPFAGTMWVLTGFTNASLYFESSPLVASVLVPAMLRVLRGDPPQHSHRLPPTTTTTTTTTPPGRITVSGGHLRFKSTGRRFFMVGTNYYRDPNMNIDIAGAVAAAASVGLNTMRLFNMEKELLANDTFLEEVRQAMAAHNMHAVVELDYAAKYPTAPPLPDIAANVSALAALLANDTWVAAYDLGNEPYYWEVAALTLNATATVGDSCPPYATSHNTFGVWLKSLNPGPSSTFPNLPHGLPTPPPDVKPGYDAVSCVYSAWIKAKSDAIRAHDGDVLITVGYNTIYGTLPAAASLDIVNHHTYPNGPEGLTLSNFTAASWVPTTYDRLAAAWPGRPITYGEFGASSGDIVASGATLTLGEAAAFDATTWLYALAHGHDGGNRWRTFDTPTPMSVILQAYNGNISTNYAKYQRESYFGLFAYTGDPSDLRPKPVALWLRFFTQYVGGGVDGVSASLSLAPSESSVHIGHVFVADDAVFCGGWAVQQCNPWLAYSGVRDVPSVGVVNGSNIVQLHSNVDAFVNVTTARFGISASTAVVTGVFGSLSRTASTLSVLLLGGEVVSVAPARR